MAWQEEPAIAHDHHHSGSDGHRHHHHAGSNGRRLGWAASLTLALMLAEIVGGVLSGSLALLADAGHMFTDFAGLLLAWFGTVMAARPADPQRSYGHGRFSVLVAFSNGLLLIAVAGVIVWEAVERLAEPSPVLALPMLAVAIAGLIANVAAFAILHGGERDLNLRGALLHVVGDLLGSVGAILAAVIILLTGWTAADPILSALVAVLILRSAVTLVRDAGRILLEAAPVELDSRAIAADLEAHVAGVADVHHLHLWSISEARRIITLHARLTPDCSGDAAISAIKGRLAERFGIDHATVEIERGPCADAPPHSHHAHA